MPLMTWTSELSVGVKVLDDDHKKLVEMLNRLNEGMQANRGRATLGKIFDELVEYTNTHFAREEGFLVESGYAEVDVHKKQHADLVMRVLDLQRRYNNGELTLTREVLNFLKDWLTYHIKGHDQKYGSHLTSREFIDDRVARTLLSAKSRWQSRAAATRATATTIAADKSVHSTPKRSAYTPIPDPSRLKSNTSSTITVKATYMRSRSIVKPAMEKATRAMGVAIRMSNPS